MRFGSETGTKLDYARRIAATLAYVAIGQGDAVGLTLARDHGVVDIPPSRRTSHLRVVNDTLATAKAEGETGIVAVLHDLAEKIRQRALVVVVSDLFVEPEPLADAFQHLRFRKHDVAVFQLLDDMEIDFPFDRPTRFVDLEGGAPILTDAATLAPRYRAALAAWREGIEKAVREAAVDHREVRLQVSYDRVLADFLVDRARRKAKR